MGSEMYISELYPFELANFDLGHPVVRVQPLYCQLNLRDAMKVLLFALLLNILSTLAILPEGLKYHNR